MSQNILTNTTTPPLAGSTAIGVLNLAADSLARWFCGPATPTAGAAGLADLKGFVWHDTSTNTLKVRDQADANWIVVGYFDETAKTFTPHANPAAVYAADSGSANAYAVAPTPAWASYAAGGPLVAFVAAHPNPGPSTINICGLGTKSVVRQDGAPLLAGDIPGTEVSVLIWNQAAGTFALLTQKHAPLAFIKGTVANLRVATTSAATQSTVVTADAVVLLDAGNNPYLATAVSQTPSLSTSGAGGLDAGSVAPSTWYSVWLIWNGTTLSAIFSVSATAPTLPGAYAFKVRVGWVLTDGSSNIRAFTQAGRRASWINAGSGLQKMASGVAGSNSGTYVNVPTAAFVPPTAAAVDMIVVSSSSYTGVAPNDNYGGYLSTTNPPAINIGVASQQIEVQGSLMLEGADIYWFSSGANGAIYAAGWEDNL